jgi:hypothetical protein
MSGSREKSSLTRNQIMALTALVQQPTLTLAAAQVGVSDKTLYRWLHHDSLFKAEYLKIRKEIICNAVFQLQKATDTAVSVAISLMSDPETPASTRLAGARVILELSLEALRAEALEEKVQQLEERLAEFNESRSKGGRNGMNYPSTIR